MRIWRLTSKRYADTAFDGLGTHKKGGRWSPPGAYVVYTSRNLSLCVLEQMVHLDVRHMKGLFVSIPVDLPNGCLMEVIEAEEPITDIEEDVRVEVRNKVTHDQWRGDPVNTSTVKLGDAWIKDSKSAILRVPSAIVPSESNFLINVEHSDFRSFKIGEAEEFLFDDRL